MSHEDKKILDHEPVPGYRPAFYVIFAISVAYLALIFLRGA